MDATVVAAAYVDGATLTTLAATHNTDLHHIRKALRTQGVPLRTRSEVARLRELNDVPLPPEMIQRVEGELLGDGSLKSQKHQSFFSFRTSDLNYASWLADFFVSNGMPLIGQGVNTEQLVSFGALRVAHSFRTVSTVQLQVLRQKWYHQGRKCVPGDLELSPLHVLHWWIGDGSVRGECAGLLCTDAFTLDEQRSLVDKLSKTANIRSHIVPWGSYHRIYIHSASMLDFLTYIGPAPFPSIAYKWQARAPKRVLPFRTGESK
jgi:hypothetical protein